MAKGHSRTTQPSATGRTVRALRDVAGLSQRELAKRASSSRATVAAVEHGRYRGTDSKTLEKLAAALGVAPSLLLEGDHELGESRAGHTTPEAFVEAFIASRWAPAIKASETELEWLRALSFSIWRGIDPSPQGAAELIAWRRRNGR